MSSRVLRCGRGAGQWPGWRPRPPAPAHKRHSEIDMSRAQVVYVEPHVRGEAVLDELLVLVLVLPSAAQGDEPRMSALHAGIAPCPCRSASHWTPGKRRPCHQAWRGATQQVGARRRKVRSGWRCTGWCGRAGRAGSSAKLAPVGRGDGANRGPLPRGPHAVDADGDGPRGGADGGDDAEHDAASVAAGVLPRRSYRRTLTFPAPRT